MKWSGKKLCSQDLPLNYAITDPMLPMSAKIQQPTPLMLDTRHWCYNSDCHQMVLRPVQEEWISRHLLLHTHFWIQVSHDCVWGIDHAPYTLVPQMLRKQGKCFWLPSWESTNKWLMKCPKQFLKGAIPSKAWHILTSWSSTYGWRLDHGFQCCQPGKVDNIAIHLTYLL